MLPAESGRQCEAAARVPAQTQPGGHATQPSSSFAVVEDAIAPGHHQRASTIADVNCDPANQATASFQLIPDPAFHGRPTAKRRHGAHLPRIFTGSFSQLESNIYGLGLHRVITPDQPQQPPLSDLKIRDFAVSPQHSQPPTPNSTSMLFRREAILSKETELQERVINGQTFRSRRPPIRAQTVDETSSGLERWLAESKHTARGIVPALQSLSRPERKNTI